MKKILMGLIIISSIVLAEVPEKIDTQIRSWVKTTYPVDTYGSSTQKMMYQEEIESYEWLQKNVKSDDDLKILKRVMGIYDPETYGYSTVLMMYQDEKENSDW